MSHPCHSLLFYLSVYFFLFTTVARQLYNLNCVRSFASLPSACHFVHLKVSFLRMISLLLDIVVLVFEYKILGTWVEFGRFFLFLSIVFYYPSLYIFLYISLFLSISLSPFPSLFSFYLSISIIYVSSLSLSLS